MRATVTARVDGWIDGRYLLAAMVLGAAAAALGVLAHAYDTFPLDRAVGAQARALGPGYAPIAYVFNELNNVIALTMIGGGALVLLLRRRIDAALIFVLAGGLRPLLSDLKGVVDRPRPSGDFAVLDAVNDSSFPSGHTMTAVTCFGLWFLLAGEILPRRWVLPARVISVLAVALYAVSRMWAGVHWLSDTYGAVLWASTLLLALMAIRPLLRAAVARAADAARRLRPARQRPVRSQERGRA